MHPNDPDDHEQDADEDEAGISASGVGAGLFGMFLVGACELDTYSLLAIGGCIATLLYQCAGAIRARIVAMDGTGPIARILSPAILLAAVGASILLRRQMIEGSLRQGDRIAEAIGRYEQDVGEIPRSLDALEQRYPDTVHGPKLLFSSWWYFPKERLHPGLGFELSFRTASGLVSERWVRDAAGPWRKVKGM
ncbi:MAG: hypothetical protein R3F30_04015 [Planctomycetota bacterium]